MALFLYLLDVVQKRTLRLTLPGVRASCRRVGDLVYHYLYYQAMARAPLAEAAILATTWSFWIVVFPRCSSSPAAAGDRPHRPGRVVRRRPKDRCRPVDPASSEALGYGLALLCGLVWSSFSVGLSRLGLREEPMTAFTVYAAVLSGVLFVLIGPASRALRLLSSGRGWLCAARPLLFPVEPGGGGNPAR